MNSLRSFAYIAVLQAMLLAMLLHAPWSNPSLYTDIIAFFWVDYATRGLTPYLDLGADGEPFEYPYLAGGISVLAWRLGGSEAGFYIAYSLIVIGFALLMAHAILELSSSPLAILCLTAPSMVVYGIYGYDVILVGLTAASILAFAKRRYLLSAFLLALAFHVKILSILFLPYALLRLEGRDRVRYFAAFAAAVVAPILAMPRGFLEMLEYQTSWGLENAWFVYLFPDAAYPLTRFQQVPVSVECAKAFGYCLMALLYMLGLKLGLRLPPQRFMALAAAAYLLGTPRYSPQTSILLLPFLASFMTPRMIPAFLLWELANASIILTWFTTEAPHMPWQPPQVASLIRFVALLALFIQMVAAARGLETKIPSISLMRILRKIKQAS